jgi:hypothetical protein
MPAEDVSEALRATLRRAGIGHSSPYRLRAGMNGRSFGCFGFMPGDLTSGDPDVRQTFRDALLAAGVSGAVATGLVWRLSQTLRADPLDRAERAQVDAALDASRGLVDAMDTLLLGRLLRDLDLCLAAAESRGRSVAPAALPYLALWMQAAGAATVLSWVNGLAGGREPIGAGTVREYLCKPPYGYLPAEAAARICACAAGARLPADEEEE